MGKAEKPAYPLRLDETAPPDGLVYFKPGTIIYPETHARSGFTVRDYLFALAISSKINRLSGFIAITSVSGTVSYNGHDGTIHQDEYFGAYADKAHKY